MIMGELRPELNGEAPAAGEAHAEGGATPTATDWCPRRSLSTSSGCAGCGCSAACTPWQLLCAWPCCCSALLLLSCCQRVMQYAVRSALAAQAVHHDDAHTRAHEQAISCLNRQHPQDGSVADSLDAYDARWSRERVSLPFKGGGGLEKITGNSKQS